MQVLTEAERREIARRHLESAEAWLRRVIDYQLSAAFGPNYWDATIPPTTTPVINLRLRKAVAERRATERDHWHCFTPAAVPSLFPHGAGNRVSRWRE
jgi:hypothetical protein